MKTLFLGATALALIVSSAAFAAPHDHGGGHGGQQHGGGGNHATTHSGGHGGSHSGVLTPHLANPLATPHGGGDHHDNQHNGTSNPFGGHGSTHDHGNGVHNNGGHSHNNAFNAFRRAFNAPRHYHYRGGAYRGPSGWAYQRWSIGAFLPALYWSNSYWISDYNYYGLDNAPPGTVWVRYGNDALLIDQDSGEVIQVVYGIFY
ncbi:MAG TPA: RcnB family protein [Pirellulales bacterium]